MTDIKKQRKPAATMDNATAIISKLNLEEKVALAKELKALITAEVTQRNEAAKAAMDLTSDL